MLLLSLQSLITRMHLWFKSKCAPAQSSVLHLHSPVFCTYTSPNCKWLYSQMLQTLWMVSSCWEHYMTALNHTCSWVGLGDVVGCHLWDSNWMDAGLGLKRRREQMPLWSEDPFWRTAALQVKGQAHLTGCAEGGGAKLAFISCKRGGCSANNKSVTTLNEKWRDVLPPFHLYERAFRLEKCSVSIPWHTL